jgi:uncharacterized membrane protein
MDILILLIILASFTGLYIAYQIKKNKSLHNQGQQMVCLVGHKCDEVVFSDYSKFFGINLEIMGFVYYLGTALLYLTYLLKPDLITEFIMFTALGVTFGGFLFSIYLTYIQIFKLKSLCSWCLTSALMSTLIFFFSYSIVVISKPEVLIYINTVAPYIRSFEIITLILGFIIFTILEIITFKYLRDLKISEKENNILKNIAQISWFVLFLFILNNTGLYLSEFLVNDVAVKNLGGGIFYSEIIAIILIIINTTISTIQVLPELKEITVLKKSTSMSKLKSFRKFALIQSLFSIFLWLGLIWINIF